MNSNCNSGLFEGKERKSKTGPEKYCKHAENQVYTIVSLLKILLRSKYAGMLDKTYRNILLGIGATGWTTGLMTVAVGGVTGTFVRAISPSMPPKSRNVKYGKRFTGGTDEILWSSIKSISAYPLLRTLCSTWNDSTAFLSCNRWRKMLTAVENLECSRCISFSQNDPMESGPQILAGPPFWRPQTACS